MDFNKAIDDGVAVASAGPYENHLHLAPVTVTTSASHHSVRSSWQCQSTEGKYQV